MVPVFPITNVLLLCMLIAGARRCSASPPSDETSTYVEDACRVTRYLDICMRSLSPFSDTARTDPIKWARAGVSVTIREAKAVAHYAAWMKRGGGGGGAVCDCVELFEDAIDSLHMSLYALRDYSGGGAWRSEDVVTWLSAALTDEDTCLDGFKDAGGRRRKAEGIQGLENRVVNMTYMTSNALALVNKLANPN